ncbi:MAG: hypothetical protein E5V54_09785 [Mesorhizobium sp.]|nr:MAG: hypothetical protein E5V54_09785 [Mesorhizobium sp.]TIW84184.1 MAG: hypothetical protein E5V53_00990 [Mesorhizobium sp.]
MERISAGPHHTAYKIGDLTVTSLRDGYVDMPVRRLHKPGGESFGDDLPPQVPLFDGALRLSVNAFAIDDGHEITLIDTGSSNAWHPTMGLLPTRLAGTPDTRCPACGESGGLRADRPGPYPDEVRGRLALCASVDPSTLTILGIAHEKPVAANKRERRAF